MLLGWEMASFGQIGVGAQDALILGRQESRPFIMRIFNVELGKREKIGKMFLSLVGVWGLLGF